MKRLILDIPCCDKCVYSISFQKKVLCRLSDKQLVYDDIKDPDKIPEWCELEDAESEEK